MTFKFWACGGIKFDEKCAILQICKCNNYSEVHLLIAADGSVITELTEDHVARINSTVENSIVKKEITWRKKIYNLLRRKLQLSTPNYDETTTIYEKVRGLEHVCR